MLGSIRFCFLIASLSLHCFTGTGKKHKPASVHKKVQECLEQETVPKGRVNLIQPFIASVRDFIRGKNGRFHFHSTQDVDDLVKNPTALNRDEASEINKLDNMNDMFMNSEVTSETQDLSRQGLDPYVAMQISKLDHNFEDILGPKTPDQASSKAKQKGEILPGYGEQYNADGSISLSNSEWPEYQMQDTPPLMGMRRPSLSNMLPVNTDDKPQISPQAALNPNLLPGQKADLGMGMGVGMGMEKKPLMLPAMSRFFNDANGANDEKSMDKTLMNQPFAKPGIKSAGFRIPGQFSFKGDRKSARESAEEQEEANFVKNFMSSKKSRTEKKKKAKKAKH